MKLPAQPPFHESELTSAVFQGARRAKARAVSPWRALRWGGLVLAVWVLLEPYWP